MRVFGSNALPTMSVMQAQMKPYVSLPNNSIALTMLSAKYASVKDNALTSNLLYQQNNQLYDVANRTQSPYQAHEAFVVAPVAEEFEGLYFSFVFRSDLLYSNYGLQSNQISTLQIDTDNGQGWQTVAWNTPLQVSYAQAGRKLLKYKFTFSNGNVREGHSYFKVKNPPQEVQRYATTEDFGLNFAGGNYYVRAVFQNGSYTSTKTVVKQ